LITEKLIINYSPLSPKWGVSDASLFLKGIGRIKAPYQGGLGGSKPPLIREAFYRFKISKSVIYYR
jgi:hypothetical protein